MTRMTADVAGDGVPGADVIIEAIFENAEAKHELFAPARAAHEGERHPRVEHFVDHARAAR